MAMRSVLIKGDVLISGVSPYGGIQVHHMHQYNLQVYIIILFGQQISTIKVLC